MTIVSVGVNTYAATRFATHLSAAPVAQASASSRFDAYRKDSPTAEGPDWWESGLVWPMPARNRLRRQSAEARRPSESPSSS